MAGSERDWARIILRITLLWVILMLFAFAEGVIRVLLLEPRLARMVTEVLGVVLVSTTGLIIAYVAVGRRWLPRDVRKLWLVGAIWVTYTVLFEFLFFHFVMGMSWAEIAASFNLFEGRLFPIGLGVLFVTPYAMYRFWQMRNTTRGAAG